jgi:serine/threonine-protein kinase
MSWNGDQGPLKVGDGAPAGALPEVPGFEILGRIGRGGMGTVYRAWQLSLGRPVAIKFWDPEDDLDPGSDLARFRREAELMAQVSHPYVVSLFEFGEAEGRPYLVMEYVEGGDLRQLMRPGEPMPVDRARALLRPITEALAFLHRRGIIHRDLKPENILLHDGVTPRVSDFGIAVFQAGAGSLTRTGRGLGTLGYVAPEQQYRLKVDERADQYSLAALAYELLTGQLPLGVFKPPSQLNPRLRSAVDAAILRALHENPKDRFETVGEFADVLDAALTARPRLGKPTPLRLAGVAALGVSAIVAAFALGTGAVVRAPLAARRPDASPAPPGPAAVPEPKKDQPLPLPDDPLTEELKRLIAVKIWEEQGSPKGEEGEKVREENWFKASERLKAELSQIAYQIWEQQGSPNGAAGKAVEKPNWEAAKRKHYKSLTGRDYQEPVLFGSHNPRPTP